MTNTEPGTDGIQPTTRTPAEAAPTRLMVILFTDIVGSVDLKKRLGDSAAARVIARHDDLFKEVVGATRGAEIVQDTGDGFLARFANVEGAVEAALRFQQAVRSEPWREQPIQLRAGLHLGDVAATGKISALAVDIASRVMGLAMPGQILMTRAVFDDARQHVRKHPGADDQGGASELRWMAHGPYLFKGNDEPMEVCEVGVERISPLRPPPDSEKAKRAIKAGDEQRYGLRPAVAQPVPQNERWILQSRVGRHGSGEAWFATDTRTGASREFTFDFAGNVVRSEDQAAIGCELRPGERVGNYVIREQIGEGGFAIVYAAEQERPVRRKVALKIMKLRMDTNRFDTERQALATMDHPNVAKVFDAGSTEAGRPYFVMEYVAGTPIDEYCDRQRLNIEERLQIFIQVCEAVQHGHQKAVIHRDIRPSNVLVSTKEGAPVVKVIDFGVAKAIAQRLTEKTIYAGQGQLIGTPEYMSPEQAEMTADDIDTHTDIYALGVILYELLAGLLPFDRSVLQSGTIDQVQTMIREVQPPKPSARLGAPSFDLKHAAELRRTSPPVLRRRLRGELDWITMKAMEKDRSRRYETAEGLAMDLRRHLDHEPVLAGPPSVGYRARKFIRRNRVAALAGSMVALTLMAATAVSFGFAINAAKQRRVAVTERDIAQTINDFLTAEVLGAVDPGRPDHELSKRDLLDLASKNLEGKFEGQPLVEASIRASLGEIYRSLAAYENAEEHLNRALELRRAELGGEHPDTLMSMNALADLYLTRGRHEEATTYATKALELSRAVPTEQDAVASDPPTDEKQEE